MSDGTLLQFVGSLIAITLLVLLSRWLGLGGAARLRDEAEAREIAEDAICGFGPREVVLDAKGRGALLVGASGRIMLLAPHGSKFSARLLDWNCRTKVTGDTLAVDTGETNFPTVRLELGQQIGAWAPRLVHA